MNRSATYDLAFHFVLLSLVAVGGANAVVPDMHRFVVDSRHWMTAAEFSKSFALAQAAPGPNVLIVALIGLKVAGVFGAVLSLLAMCVPPSLLTYALSGVWDRHRAQPWLRAVQSGILPLTTGLVLASGYLIALGTTSARGYALAALAAAVAYRFKGSPLWILGAGALAGALGFG